jgi:hypothetical protein
MNKCAHAVSQAHCMGACAQGRHKRGYGCGGRGGVPVVWLCTVVVRGVCVLDERVPLGTMTYVLTLNVSSSCHQEPHVGDLAVVHSFVEGSKPTERVVRNCNLEQRKADSRTTALSPEPHRCSLRAALHVPRARSPSPRWTSKAQPVLPPTWRRRHAGASPLRSAVRGTGVAVHRGDRAHSRQAG